MTTEVESPPSHLPFPSSLPPPPELDCNSTSFWPNPCVSSFPIHTSSDWGGLFSITYFIFLLSFGLFLSYRLFIYRAVFPVSLIPIHLYMAMALITPINFLALTNPMIVPSMPCWLHIVLCNWNFLPTSGGSNYKLSL